MVEEGRWEAEVALTLRSWEISCDKLLVGRGRGNSSARNAVGSSVEYPYATLKLRQRSVRMQRQIAGFQHTVSVTVNGSEVGSELVSICEASVNVCSVCARLSPLGPFISTTYDHFL